jgi:hypothetical protein
MMTLLQLIQAFCRRTGIPAPVSVADSGDDQALQMMGLLNELLGILEERKAYTFLQTEAVFLSIEGEDQGLLESLAPGFVSFLDNLLFNRTSNEVILGPVSSTDWQSKAAGMASLSATQYRIRNQRLFLSPSPAVGSEIAFEYKSRFAVYLDPNLKPYFTSDNDTCRYPDELMILGLRYLWRREKGLRYAENFRDFEYKVMNLAGTDGGNRPISLDAEPSARPGISVPDRGWRVS